MLDNCAYCGSTILFGGAEAGGLKFCNAKCRDSGSLLAAGHSVPEDLVEEAANVLHQGQCPKCGGRGPVDVHVSHRVWSLIFLTSWSSRPQVCCRSCGIKSQVFDTALSAALGWWGFPWGLLMTPIQIGRNIYGVVSGPSPTQPSAKLKDFTRILLVSRAQAHAETPDQNQEVKPS